MTEHRYRAFVAFAAALAVGCFAASSRHAAPAPPVAGAPAAGFAQEGGGKKACLECHGPFDELAKRTAGYQAPSGETGTPHRYVPHSESEGREIPECTGCHQVHPVPPSADDLAGLRKPTVAWCYEKCHHTKDFTPCKACHPGRGAAYASGVFEGVRTAGPGSR